MVTPHCCHNYGAELVQLIFLPVTSRWIINAAFQTFTLLQKNAWFTYCCANMVLTPALVPINEAYKPVHSYIKHFWGNYRPNEMHWSWKGVFAVLPPPSMMHYWGRVSQRGLVELFECDYLTKKLSIHKPYWGTVLEENSFASNSYFIMSDYKCISDGRLYCFKSAILSCTGEEVDCPVLSLYLCCFEAMNIMWVMRSDLLVKCILCAWYYGSSL